MTPSSKAKVLTDEQIERARQYVATPSDRKILLPPLQISVAQFVATIDALKAELAQAQQDVKKYVGIAASLGDELALKDKVVEAAREIFDTSSTRAVYTRLQVALNDLDKVMAR